DSIRDLIVTGVQTCALPIFGQAEAGVWKEWNCDRGKCERHCGWRRGGGVDVTRRGAEAEYGSTGANCELGHCWSGSEDYGQRTGSGYKSCVAKGRDDAGAY